MDVEGWPEQLPVVQSYHQSDTLWSVYTSLKCDVHIFLHNYTKVFCYLLGIPSHKVSFQNPFHFIFNQTGSFCSLHSY